MGKQLSELAFFTDKVEEMAEFYRALLRAEPVAQSEGMAIFMSGNTKIFIHRNYIAEKGDLPPENHIAFTVDDVDMVCTELVENGLSIEVSPKDYYWGRSAYLRDPDGQLVEITRELNSS